MRTSAGALLVVLTSRAVVGAPHDHPRGDCALFSWDMTREFELLGSAPTTITALASADPGARLAPLEQRLDLTRLSSKQVKLQGAPRREPAPESQAGILRLRVPRAGSYPVSASQRPWIEVVGPAGPAKSTRFAMQTGCEALRKSVAFPLEADSDYWVELSGSFTTDPVLLITQDR